MERSSSPESKPHLHPLNNGCLGLDLSWASPLISAMVMLEFTPMTFLKWALLACLVCSSLSLQIPNLTQSCDPNDLRALKEFAGNLTNGSIFFLWSNDSHCCRWDGVALGRLDHLKFLDLSSNQLDGELPMELSNLHQLEMIDLSMNHFTGGLEGLGNCSFTSLQNLHVDYNSLSGQLPEFLFSLPSLEQLSIPGNNFSGHLSRKLSKLHSLKALVIFGNRFRGPIPNVFGNLTQLEILIAHSNSFYGNDLRGPVPESFANLKYLSKLQVLDLSWNHLDGSIPPWIGEMENLFYLDFSNNSLTGRIPKSLTELKSLIFTKCNSSNITTSAGIPLYVKRNQSANGLQYNQVSSFPPSIFLSNNRINGTIWPEIGKLKQLHVLDLSRNNITGTIPDSISNMGNLEVLDLSCNDLHGEIPSSLNKLTFLSKFSVADNQLRGMIPTGGQFLSFPNSSFEGNPGLCGEVYIPYVGDPIVDLDEEISRPHRLSEVLGSSKLVLFQNSGCKDLSVADLLKSTNNFNQANIIGCGGFGLVYKANLPDGTRAAIKRLSGDCGQMEREFRAEVEALSRAQHKNLVSLQGYCRHGNDRLLIYSYMENGSLDYWLHERVDGGSFLTWDTRVKIAQGAGRGLAYLHKVCEPSVVHRDIKSSNILLDETFEAHLADFGLSRLLRPYDTHVTTDLVGTLGYIPPEYSQTLTATFKGDVYSFGVVLLELLTGRRPVEVCKGKNCRDLVSWVFQMKSEKKEEQIMDSSVWDKDREKQFLEVLGIACRCIDQDPRQRPSIDQVVSWLDAVGKEGVLPLFIAFEISSFSFFLS
ncbi:unnamed protein product, partial [Vitis vinifera]